MTQRRRVRGYALAAEHFVRGALAIFVLGLFMLLAAAAQAAPHTFTKVADSARDNFNPFSFTCASINNRGDVAFKAGRTSSDGLNSFDGIYRANANGTLTTIVEDPARKRFGFFSNSPSMNNLGDVSFAANLQPNSEEGILRGDGRKLTTIATTEKGFNFFGFDTSVNDSGEVAFKGELDNFDEGLFSGQGRGLTTHYLNSSDVSVDWQPARFGGNDSRPSINNLGQIAFDESIQPEFDSGIFAGRAGSFRTIEAPDPNRSVRAPVLNDGGTAAFETTFFDETGQFVDAIVTDNGPTQTTVADTRGSFIAFFFRPPSINNSGEVAYGAFFDGGLSSGIFTGPDPKKDLLIATGDRLDGATVSNGGLSFCEEGLNDSGRLAFIAQLDDPSTRTNCCPPPRTAVFVATPRQ